MHSKQSWTKRLRERPDAQQIRQPDGEEVLAQNQCNDQPQEEDQRFAAAFQEVCDVFGITETMQGTVLPTLAAWADECGFTLLDYEWGGSVITDDDKQFFDGFHLDERYGLPEWTQELFGDIAR